MSAKGNYRALFNGGRHPQAIARLRTNGAVDELLWHAAEWSNPPTCDFPAPPRLPTGTTFVGVGVCQDEEAQSVPCAVFRDKSSQRVTIVDHLVLYRADGLGPFHTTTIHLGVNEDAAPARLAFQIGLELLKTSCCQRRGLKYIEHAYRLFPRSLVYRSAYQHYRRQTLDGTPVAHWRAHDEETH